MTDDWTVEAQQLKHRRVGLGGATRGAGRVLDLRSPGRREAAELLANCEPGTLVLNSSRESLVQLSLFSIRWTSITHLMKFTAKALVLEQSANL